MPNVRVAHGACRAIGQMRRVQLARRKCRKCLPLEREAVEKEIRVVDRDGEVHQGAQAMLTIAERQRGLGFLAKIGAFPFVRSLLPIGRRVAWNAPSAASIERAVASACASAAASWAALATPAPT